MSGMDNTILFVPVSGYISDEQFNIHPAEMANLGFDESDIGWAVHCGVGDSRSVASGTCTCVLIRMK